MIWSVLRIQPTKDKKEIINAYRAQLFHTNPEDEPEKFKELRSAYEEATIRLEKLQYLKQNPRDEEVNQLLLLQGERLYQEMPEYRYEIDRALTEFEQVLARQNRTENRIISKEN